MILRQSKFLHVGGLSLFFLFWKTSCRGLTPLRIRSLTDARSTGGAVITSSTLWIKPAFDEECEEDDDDREKEKQTLRPTMTESEVQGPAVQPEKPKIVVLGASGRIGRLVVQQLMERKDVDMTVVAFVRDLGKANWALFDDILVPRYVKKRGPELQLVLGDLVPSEELAHFYDRDEEKDWKRRAKSAARFFGNNMKDYDNREFIPDCNEALREAIQGASTIISCVGANRFSNVWSDYICFWRLFQRDVSKWCNDPKHPYYVHFQSTQKVLGYVEEEQRKRDQARQDKGQSDKAGAVNKERKKKIDSRDRIRFIRISDLILSKSPWMFIPVFTNMIQSMVIRYQDMTERLLEESSLIDTIILRPGDLTDEERDPDITYLQVDESGNLPYPALVSREDVASLAVAAALFQTGNLTSSSPSEVGSDLPPFHMNLAVRWCGEIDPPHASFQGRKEDGCIDANAAFHRVLLGHDELQRKRKRPPNQNLLRRFAYQMTRRRLKPYAIFVAIPVYMMLGLMLSSIITRLPGGEDKLLFARDLLPLQLWRLLKHLYSTATGGMPSIRKLISLRDLKYIGI